MALEKLEIKQERNERRKKDRAMEKIEDKISRASNRMGSNMHEAQKMYEEAKARGLIKPKSYDIPLMTRLSSRYAGKNEKLATNTPERLSVRFF